MTHFLTCFCFIVLLLAATPAGAVTEGTACTQGAGTSVLEESSGRHTRYVCDGSVYRELESWSDAGWQTVRLGTANGYNALVATCNTAQEGILMYDKNTNKMLFCNGTFWQSVGLSLYIPGL